MRLEWLHGDEGTMTLKGYVDKGESGTLTTPVFSEGAQKGIFVE